MSKTVRMVWLLMTLSAGYLPPALAQTASSLHQALEAAWSRQAATAALSARRGEARARIDQAQGFTPAPASVSLSQLNDKLNQSHGRQEWEVEVATPLWLPGQRHAAIAEAQSAQAQYEAQAAALRWQLAGEVREAWWAMAAAQATQQLARQRLETAQALSRSVERRVKAGDLARLDGNLAQAESLAAQAEALQADQALLTARQAYRSLTGQEAPDTLMPEATSLAPLADTHPQLTLLQAVRDAAQSHLARVDASHRDAPELALRWNNQRSDALTPYSQAVGIKLTVPLASGPRISQDSAASRAELAQAETELTLAQARVEQTIQSAQTELATTEQQLTLAKARQALTADNLQLSQRAFDLGETDLPTLLRVRAAALEAQAWLQRQTVARAAAQSHLLQAQGVLP